MTFEDVMKVLRCVIDGARERYEFVPFDEVAECVRLDYGISDREYVREVLRILERRNRVHRVGQRFFPTVYGVVEEKLYEVHKGLNIDFVAFRRYATEVARWLIPMAIEEAEQRGNTLPGVALGLVFSVIAGALKGRKARADLEFNLLVSPSGISLKSFQLVKPDMTGLEALRYFATYIGCITRYLVEHPEETEKEEDLTPEEMRKYEEYLNKCVIEHMD
jgi:hypothetical protein